MINQRIQTKRGGLKPWTNEEIRAGFELFYKEHSRYPTAQEIDAYPYLPSIRTIQRAHGGVVNLRKSFHLESQSDLRTGAHSSNRAKIINERNNANEDMVHSFLIDIFHKELVHREFLFKEDKRVRADFFVYDAQGGFCVDLFYPNSIHNLLGCLNNKQKVYTENLIYPVIFLQLNKDIDQKTLDAIVERKDRKLLEGQLLMDWDTFVKFCQERRPLSIQNEL